MRLTRLPHGTASTCSSTPGLPCPDPRPDSCQQHDHRATGRAAPPPARVGTPDSLGEEGEAVAVRVEHDEFPASGPVLARLGRRGESVSEYGAVEVVDV